MIEICLQQNRKPKQPYFKFIQSEGMADNNTPKSDGHVCFLGDSVLADLDLPELRKEFASWRLKFSDEFNSGEVVPCNYLLNNGFLEEKAFFGSPTREYLAFCPQYTATQYRLKVSQMAFNAAEVDPVTILDWSFFNHDFNLAWAILRHRKVVGLEHLRVKHVPIFQDLIESLFLLCRKRLCNTENGSIAEAEANFDCLMLRAMRRYLPHWYNRIPWIRDKKAYDEAKGADNWPKGYTDFVAQRKTWGYFLPDYTWEWPDGHNRS